MGKSDPAAVHIELNIEQAQAAVIALGTQLEKWKELQVTNAWSPKMGRVMAMCQAAQEEMFAAIKAALLLQSEP